MFPRAEATTLRISVVIPTRNRPASLHRLLAALSGQQRLPDEVVVSDASDAPQEEAALQQRYPQLTITRLLSAPSVCAQRNAGIRRAQGSHVLLCDDDIEPPPEYLRRLEAYLAQHPDAGAVTGVVCEPRDGGEFSCDFSVPSSRHVIFRFLFQLTEWADVQAATGSWIWRLPLSLATRWYRRRGNTWSLAGWPLVTQVRDPVVHTVFYALGGALVRRDWLMASPYDERLGAHGIGDHYGVALRFPAHRGVAVLTDLRVRHHRVADNRLDEGRTYYQRVLALDYFMRQDRRFSRLNTLFLTWSLLGNVIGTAMAGRLDLTRLSLRALALIGTGRNPLLHGAHAPAVATPPAA